MWFGCIHIHLLAICCKLIGLRLGIRIGLPLVASAISAVGDLMGESRISLYDSLMDATFSNRLFLSLVSLAALHSASSSSSSISSSLSFAIVLTLPNSFISRMVKSDADITLYFMQCEGVKFVQIDFVCTQRLEENYKLNDIARKCQNHLQWSAHCSKFHKLNALVLPIPHHSAGFQHAGGIAHSTIHMHLLVQIAAYSSVCSLLCTVFVSEATSAFNVPSRTGERIAVNSPETNHRHKDKRKLRFLLLL